MYKKYKDDKEVQKIVNIKQLPTNQPDFKKLNCIKIAFKFNYDGHEFNGLALQA